jgi:outer membrane murein-binding lipoprotein Lpp
MARSNSANAPTICIIIRPAGVVVSIVLGTQDAKMEILVKEVEKRVETLEQENEALRKELAAARSKA